MSRRELRTYHDPLHGAISLDSNDATEALLIDLIDTAPFQRLRRIRQLGPASLTFHGAESSRFTHSLGVLAITRRVFDRLAKQHPQLYRHRPAVLCAALLHDIGHGPFSHTAEEIFGSRHEYWTRRIIREHPDVQELLIRLATDLPVAIDQVFTHRHPLALVWQLVSSQLDCDRLDYLLRDSYFTGASYGSLDLDRILLAMAFDPASGELVVAHKGLAAIEHYLVVRYFMYAQVYNHPKNLAATWLLEQAFQQARCLMENEQLEADAIVRAWLLNPPDMLNLETYLAGDDIVFQYHLQRWQQSADPLLADLCNRWVNRRLFKALEVTELQPEIRLNLLAHVQAYLTEYGLDAQIYSGLTHSWSRGYTLYQRGIKIKITPSSQLQDINQVSPLIQTLTRSFERSWLLYPQDIQAWVQRHWRTYCKG